MTIVIISDVTMVDPGDAPIIGAVDQSTVDLLAAMDERPSSSRAILIDSTIKAFKSEGIWPLLDRVYGIAHSAQASYLNWRKPGQNTLTPINAPIVIPDRGWQSPGRVGSLSSGERLALAEENYSLTKSSMWVWVTSSVRSTESQSDCGAVTNGEARINSNYTDTIFIKANTSAVADTPITTSVGFTGFNRHSAQDVDVWKNGVLLKKALVPAQQIPTGPFYILSSGGGSYSSRQVAFVAIGGDLSGKENAFYQIVRNYLLGIGAITE